MENNSKLLIYKGIIQYLLDSTNYTLKNIADLTHSSIKNIRIIYIEEILPVTFKSEKQLIQLYLMILEIHLQEKRFHRYLPLPKGYTQLNVSKE